MAADDGHGAATAKQTGGGRGRGCGRGPSPRGASWRSAVAGCAASSLAALYKFPQFVGPGFLIAVAYIDPGNYATDVAAGAKTGFALLFVVLMSNLFAIYLQSLSIKLGSVTGLNLAENCRAHLPRWLTVVLYVLAEAAIIATDIAKVSRSRRRPPSPILLAPAADPRRSSAPPSP